jgi:hypothetical protein
MVRATRNTRVVRTRGEAEPLHGGAQQTLAVGINAAVLAHLAGLHLAVVSGAGGGTGTVSRIAFGKRTAGRAD